MALACPICQSTDSTPLYPKYRGRCITSQMFFCADCELDNRCCSRCGFIFNAKGIRGIEERIYNTTVWKPKPQIKSFGRDVKTSHQRCLEIFMQLAELPESGTLLDFGAGTGAFLNEFTQAFPGWEVTALEPGDGYRQLKNIPGVVKAYNAPYYATSIDEQFDVVVVTSVLEHVADPLDGLRWIHDRLKPGGLLLMQHPNFEHLPGDLFCADHINKLTVPHTRQLCEHAGFRLLSQDTETLSFYFALKKTDQASPIPNCPAENLAIARQSEHIAESTVKVVAEGVAAAAARGGKCAIFGCTSISFMAPLILNCKEEIACFVDENEHVWGWDIDGIEVVGPNRLSSLGVTDIAIAISPLYWNSVTKKMNAFGVKVHTPKP